MALPGMGGSGSWQAGHHPDFGSQPEWPGQFSGKFVERGSAKNQGKKVVQTHIRNGDDTSLARNGFGGYFSDTRGLSCAEGKKILPSVGSQVFEWRPSKRALSQPGSDHNEKPEGRRLCDAAPGKSLAIREKRHIRQVESKEEHSDRPNGKNAVVRANGLRAADQPAREVDLSYEMQRKVPHYSLHDARNGIGCAVHGDKPYKHPEYSDEFFKAGNLVIGAGFARGHFKKTEPRNAISLVPANVVRKEDAMTFADREALNAANEARAEVEELTKQWERQILKTTEVAKYDEPSDSEDEAAAPA